MLPRLRENLRLALLHVGSTAYKRLIGERVVALVVESDRGRFAVDPADLIVGRQLRRSGRWGDDEIGRIEGFVHRTSRVLVVGAHLGSSVVPLSRLCDSIVAVEANPSTYALLRMNLALNDVGNCDSLNVAANDRSGELPFLLSPSNSGGSKRVPRSRSFRYYYDRPEEVVVEAVRLDDALRGRVFDLVVMDIEGSEHFALKGMPVILEASRALVVEFVPHHLSQVAGIDVETFLEPIVEHFSWLQIPSRHVTVEKPQFRTALQDMFDADLGDEGLVFSKERPASSSLD